MTYRNPWLGVGLEAWALGVEAQAVVALRLMKLAAGGAAAEAEALRMVAEKVEAGVKLQQAAFTGALGASPSVAVSRSIKRVRRKVRANRRRLGKG